MSVPYDWYPVAQSAFMMQRGVPTNATQGMFQQLDKHMDQTSRNSLLAMRQINPEKMDPTLFNLSTNLSRSNNQQAQAQTRTTHMASLTESINNLAQKMWEQPAKSTQSQKGPGSGAQIGGAMAGLGGTVLGMGGASFFG